jgi:transcriptional regulator with XRE-family HTH domain
LAVDGLSQREIARRLGINRRTVGRLLACEEPPRYRRAPAGSGIDRFEPVLRRLVEEWPQIKAPRATEILRADYGYADSVDVDVREPPKGMPLSTLKGIQTRRTYGSSCEFQRENVDIWRPSSWSTASMHDLRLARNKISARSAVSATNSPKPGDRQRDLGDPTVGRPADHATR